MHLKININFLEKLFS